MTAMNLKFSILLLFPNFLFLSCTKEFTCLCELYGIQEEHHFDGIKQKEAEEACANMSNWYGDEGGSCNLTEIEDQ